MKTETKITNRIDYIDILRGIGILVMIMGHVGFGGKFDRYIHSFHMPLFFIVSGYLFKFKENLNIRSYMLKKLRHLIVPYIFFGAVHYIIWFAVTGPSAGAEKPLVALFTYNNEGLPIAGALWFFTALFFADIIYCMIMHYVKNKKISGAIILVLSFGMSIITTLTDFRLPLSLDIGIVATGFIYMGGILRKFSDKFAFPNKVSRRPYFYLGIGMGLFILNGGLSFVNGYVNMKSGWYDIVPLSWANAIIGTLALSIFALYCDQRMKYIKKFLVFVGKNSIVYLCLNQVVILGLVHIIGAPIGNTGQVSIEGIGISMVIFILASVVLSLAVVVFNNTPLQKTIGK